MNTQTPRRLINNAECSRWLSLVVQKRPDLLDWASSLHPQTLACHFEGGFLHGSYNLGQKVMFSDGTTQWLVRFPLQGHVCPQFADEKVAMEVETMRLIRERTTVPVPDIKHWGLAADNPLGLGPFIIMDFVPGVPLESVLCNPDADHHFRLIREDISDDTMAFLYRQFAAIQLQLFKLDVGDRIGSLPATQTGFRAPVRPLTFKAHDIMQTGGVDVFGDRGGGFLSPTDYFQYVLQQDWAQLLAQPNAVGGDSDARTKYECLRVLETLLPRFVYPGCEDVDNDAGRCKLVCDDLSLANVIVRSKDDLTIAGLVDLEWSYAGPAQLAGSAPWWLLGIRLNNVDTYYDKDHPATTARFLRYLEIYQRVLREEEENLEEKEEEKEGGEGSQEQKEENEKKRLPTRQGTTLSELVAWSATSGAMWLHMLLLCGFNHPDSLPFVQLQQHVGTDTWKKRQRQHRGPAVDAFVERKLRQLEQYEKREDRALMLKEHLDQGSLGSETFAAELAALL
ncbi:Protein kinase-like domain protein [Niveomyces insectorum RCEF 264]|uniref:Protein kinase-like domain protein n=1 Tax=Niveomyces insectorum RCEF 264 TaxID=1081102 RepID=A0A167LUC0_9HYPO|nr:Protein kinase-like domain protein [Niveomyces insectorum RCEF 264]